MCDYSLETIQSRSAKVGDRLTTHLFKTRTRGFSAPENRDVAVCLLPGTELSFSNDNELALPVINGGAGASAAGNLDSHRFPTRAGHEGVNDDQEHNESGRDSGLLDWNDDCCQPCRKRV